MLKEGQNRVNDRQRYCGVASNDRVQAREHQAFDPGRGHGTALNVARCSVQSRHADDVLYRQDGRILMLNETFLKHLQGTGPYVGTSTESSVHA